MGRNKITLLPHLAELFVYKMWLAWKELYLQFLPELDLFEMRASV